jgi:hypothetical protein
LINIQMNKIFPIIVLLICLPVMLLAWADWKSVSTKHFRIYYKDKWETEAVEVLKTLEYYSPYLEKLTGNHKGQVPFTIEDSGNLINGYADIVSTRIVLYSYPPTSDELAVCENWWQLVACHEYIHMLQMTREGGIPKLLRMGFSNYLYPQIHQPAWMTEGITVYGESQFSPYTGRLNGGTYPSTIKALAAQGKMPSQVKASYYSFDTPHASFYTFGGAFYSYLAKTYGEERFSELFGDMSGSLTAYLNPLFPAANIDRAYLKVYGKPLSDLWKEWIEEETKTQYAFPSRKLTSDGWFKTDLKNDSRNYYYLEGRAEKTGPGSSFFSYKLLSRAYDDYISAGKGDKREQIDGRRLPAKTLIEQSNDFPAGYLLQGNMLFYTRSEYRRGFANSDLDGYGCLAELWQKDLTTGKEQMLFSGQLRAFLPLQDGNILLSEDNETHKHSTIYSFNPETKIKSIVCKSDMLVYSILQYEDVLILGAKKDWQTGSIYLMNPENGQVQSLVDTPYYEIPVSISGDILLFSAIYDGMQSTYCLDLKTLHSSYIPYSYYMRSPVITPEGKVQCISVNSEGFDIYEDEWRIQPYAINTDSMPGNSPSNQTVPDSITDDLRFSGKGATFMANLGHMAVPRLLHVPFIFGKGDSLTYGCMFQGRDATGDFPYWSAMVSYDTYYDKLKYGFSLENAFFRPVRNIIGYSNEDEQAFSSSQYITILKRMNYGLKEVTAGFSFLTSENFNRKEWSPYLQLDLGWSTGNLFTIQSVPFETRSFLPSDRERLGWQSFLRVRQKMPLSSELRIMSHMAIDPDADITSVFAPIRGYSEGIVANEGTLISSSWYKPVIQIREGLWNPQIYMEDINLGLFYDTAIPGHYSEATVQFAYGLEILAEIGLAYSIRLNIGLSVSYNKEKETKTDVIINTLF